jgi:hypothetical protein
MASLNFWRIAMASHIGRNPKASAPPNEASAKWSEPVMDHGFTIIPNLLLSQQHALGLSSLGCMLLLHLTTYWWKSDKNPFPSKATLALRMGVSSRQIQRYVAQLERGGFITRKAEPIRGKGGRTISSYDLSGLVEKMKIIAASREAPSIKDPG